MTKVALGAQSSLARRAPQASKMHILVAYLLVHALIFLAALILLPRTALAETNIFKPQLSWQRSTEASDKVVQETAVGSKVNDALQLPLDPNQVVFDDGLSTPQVNKNAVAPGISWASWIQYSAPAPNSCGPIFELRHFQAKFNLTTTNIGNVKLVSPYYPGDIIPINDNAYIYINGNSIKQIGTSYGATNIGFRGTAAYANETDGWFASGNLGSLPTDYFHIGENTLDIVAGETCWWGGMGKLELVLEIEGPIPLPVPYFSQKDLQWGSQEYDHANVLKNTPNELDCGTTMAQCGCATTAAAMILKYYGVDKSPSPTGEPTNPETLNNWLKGNKGYINGDLDWFAIARYSKISHDKFGTQIIDYLGPVRSTNFTLLNNDLSANRPVILEELSVVGLHFIIATGILDTTHAINDPISINNTTLNAYGNSFRAMRRYTPANTNLSGLIITTDAPNEFLIIDQQGRRTGKDPTTGNLYSEIPNAAYYLQESLANDLEPAEPPSEGTGHIIFESVDTELGDYTVLTSGNSTTDIIFRAYDHDAGVSEATFTNTGSAEYVLDYSPEPGSQIQVTQRVTIDIKSGSDPNSINLSAKGIIPVVILTTSSFNATQVDVSTVKFGPNQATETHKKSHLEDVDSDGDIDSALHFKTQETGIQNTDTQACLTGLTLSGVPIRGCSSVMIVGK